METKLNAFFMSVWQNPQIKNKPATRCGFLVIGRMVDTVPILIKLRSSIYCNAIYLNVWIMSRDMILSILKSIGKKLLNNRLAIERRFRSEEL